jgi:hypothetical protein
MVPHLTEVRGSFARDGMSGHPDALALRTM